MRAAAIAIALVFSPIAHAADLPAVAVIDGRDALVKVLADAGANDVPVVVHFWALWCPPCVKELPKFAKQIEPLQKAGARVVLVSVDAAKDADTKVAAALAKAGVRDPSWLLENVEFDVVSQLLDPKWDGGLPATFLVRGGKPRRAWFGPMKDSRDLLAAVRPPPPPRP